MDKVIDRKYTSYICGKCGYENFRTKDEEEDDCQECGAVMTGTTSSTSNTTTGKAISGGDQTEIRPWQHRSRKVNDIPDPVKLDLNNPNG